MRMRAMSKDVMEVAAKMMRIYYGIVPNDRCRYEREVGLHV